jgi:hypothetical protein
VRASVAQLSIDSTPSALAMKPVLLMNQDPSGWT